MQEPMVRYCCRSDPLRPIGLIAYSTVFVKASSFVNRDFAGIVAE